MESPDFENLRAKRNAQHEAFIEEMRADGWEMTREYDRNACYCGCGSGGPCEHKWDGKYYESEDGGLVTSTCSRCGMLAYSHDLRNSL